MVKLHTYKKTIGGLEWHFNAFKVWVFCPERVFKLVCWKPALLNGTCEGQIFYSFYVFFNVRLLSHIYLNCYKNQSHERCTSSDASFALIFWRWLKVSKVSFSTLFCAFLRHYMFSISFFPPSSFSSSPFLQDCQAILILKVFPNSKDAFWRWRVKRWHCWG